MKKIFLTIGFLLFPLLAQAEGDYCEFLEEFAEVIMRSRQNGEPASKLIKSSERLIGNDEWRTLSINMIKTAFREPRYSTKEARQLAIDEFASMTYLVCYKASNP